MSENDRLCENVRRENNWKRWGPYLSERQWGTVREDYSSNGNAWSYFPHDHAPARAYRWGEDGLLGISDRQCRLCFAVALWNGKDPILKERLFGLTNAQGNHGEDCKELYFYLDSTPTHSYMKALYKYPQNEFPYQKLIEENKKRNKADPEYEILDTGIFDDERYFDVQVEYAKQSPNDILMRITVSNRGSEAADIHVLPTLWYRNNWFWNCTHEGCGVRPRIRKKDDFSVVTDHESLGEFKWSVGDASDGTKPELLFTENDTNFEKLFNSENEQPYVKDAFHRYVIDNDKEAVNPKNVGTKTAAYYKLSIPSGQSVVLTARLHPKEKKGGTSSGKEFEKVFQNRIKEADTFYSKQKGEAGRIARQSYAGLLWTKQFYQYIVDDWLKGDPGQPPPPKNRLKGRNRDWKHLYNRDVISMPDKWEYPWYAAWDLAFHMIPFADIDPEFAKKQLSLFLREWYMHPNGQIPAYEWELSDVNPPVHAWSCWRTYKVAAARGHRDKSFLASTFQKLLLNFTWWVNRKDHDGNHIFSGGFLGLDNIGVFDRSHELPTGGHLNQADGTAWMAFYCGTMLAISLELAKEEPEYEDMASKFFEHFIAIVDAMNGIGINGLWDEQDGFYYDEILLDGKSYPLRIRSLVGLIPLLAVEVLEQDTINQLPGFKKRMEWFLQYRKDLSRHISYLDKKENDNAHYLLAVPSRQRLERVLRYMLDEQEFLSPFGIRSMSKFYEDNHYIFHAGTRAYRVAYTPGESDSNLFGGNSNWRGPIWFPLNYLLIESLERFHHFYGDDFQMEFPTGSGNKMNLKQIATEISKRLCSIFMPDKEGNRPWFGNRSLFRDHPNWNKLMLFHEYFHGDTGKGLGASHQTGWTALVARCLKDL